MHNLQRLGFLPVISQPSNMSNGRAGRDRGETFTLAYGVATQSRAASVKTPITVQVPLTVRPVR